MAAQTDETTRSATEEFRKARDFLLETRFDYEAARDGFAWPRPPEFNWAWDWFDDVAGRTDRTALWIVDEDGTQEKHTYSELATESRRLAGWLEGLGLSAGQSIVIMLENQAELWNVFLASIRLGLVMIPCSPLITDDDLQDRVARGRASCIVTTDSIATRIGDAHAELTRIVVGTPVAGWQSYTDHATAESVERPSGGTTSETPLIWYFTSGTTALPKLVEHTHVSYPIGHLSTMYWVGLEPGDVHMNVASPGWAKHAWSSFFAPWNAEATIFVFRYERFDANRMLDVVAECGVTSICAPPTVWRMVVQADISKGAGPALTKLVSAGEPLNPEVISQVEAEWGIVIRDGFGQTESTAAIGNPPGKPIKPGSMGLPLPGYEIRLVDPATGAAADEGEVCIVTEPRPIGLMVGYRGDEERNRAVLSDGLYRMGDIATRDEDGYVTFVGRADDVFKSSDYRISPFELESVMLEHPAVAEVAVVPSPDPIRMVVPKGVVVLAAGQSPTRDLADQLFAFSRERLAPYKRLRIIEFGDLPKTVSGKIRRTELRDIEAQRDGKEQPNVFAERK